MKKSEVFYKLVRIKEMVAEVGCMGVLKQELMMLIDDSISLIAKPADFSEYLAFVNYYEEDRDSYLLWESGEYDFDGYYCAFYEKEFSKIEFKNVYDRWVDMEKIVKDEFACSWLLKCLVRGKRAEVGLIEESNFEKFLMKFSRVNGCSVEEVRDALMAIDRR